MSRWLREEAKAAQPETRPVCRWRWPRARGRTGAQAAGSRADFGDCRCPARSPKPQVGTSGKACDDAEVTAPGQSGRS